MLDQITVNTQSSIRIEGSAVLFFDPQEIVISSHDADIVLITHPHGDHFDPKSVEKLLKPNTVLVCPETMKKEALNAGLVPEERTVFARPYEDFECKNVHIHPVPAYNVGKPFHPKKNQWLGYVVTMDGTSYYVAGDTDPNEDNEKVKCSVALIPIGGFYTMDLKRAAEFIAKIAPQYAVPTHYGSIVGSIDDGRKFRKLLQDAAPGVQTVIKL